jgi:hypothetical protein
MKNISSPLAAVRQLRETLKFVLENSNTTIDVETLLTIKDSLERTEHIASFAELTNVTA